MEASRSEIYNRRDRWASQLLDGGFKQGKRRLKKVEGKKLYHCCLGVACDVFGPEIGLKVHTPETGAYNLDNYWSFANKDTGPFSAGTMPESLRRYLGLSQQSQDILIHLNDQGVSFEIIAGVVTRLPIDLSEWQSK